MPCHGSPTNLPPAHANAQEANDNNDGGTTTPVDAADGGPISADTTLPGALQQQQQHQQPTLENGAMVQSCEDVPDGVAFAGGVLTFLRDVDCTGRLKVCGCDGAVARLGTSEMVRGI